MRRVAAVVTLLLLTVSATPAASAPLLPPSLAIRAQENAIALVTVVGFPEDGRVRFRQQEIVRPDRALELEPGVEPPPEVDVRVPPELARELAVGQPWILVYSSLEKVVSERRTFQPDPAGPRIVSVPAVGPALFEDSPAMRRLALPPDSDDAELAPRQRLDAILEQIERPHDASRLFALAELVLRVELHDELTPADEERFASFLERGDLTARAREYVLRAFLPLGDRVTVDWVLAECRRAVESYGPELDLLSAEPSLLTLALDGLRDLGSAEDAPAALRHLRSTSETVSLAAFRAAVALDPARTAEKVAPLGFAGDLPRDTQWAVVEFLAQRAERAPRDEQ